MQVSKYLVLVKFRIFLLCRFGEFCFLNVVSFITYFTVSKERLIVKGHGCFPDIRALGNKLLLVLGNQRRDRRLISTPAFVRRLALGFPRPAGFYTTRVHVSLSFRTGSGVLDNRSRHGLGAVVLAATPAAVFAVLVMVVTLVVVFVFAVVARRVSGTVTLRTLSFALGGRRGMPRPDLVRRGRR